MTLYWMLGAVCAVLLAFLATRMSAAPDDARPSIHVAYHWLTTSRYTRELESQITRLLRENEALRRDNDGLMCQMYPQLAKARKEAETGAKMPASFNWPTR